MIKQFKPRAFLPAACALLALAPGAALAREGSTAQKLVEPFVQCGEIASDAERLACFDAALGQLPSARQVAEQQDEGEVVARFGLPAREVKDPDASEAARIESTTEIIREDGDIAISSKVSEVFSAVGRRSVVLLENGQLWREGSNSSFRGEIRSGWTAVISRSTFGGFKMRFKDKSGFLTVVRVR